MHACMHGRSVSNKLVTPREWPSETKFYCRVKAIALIFCVEVGNKIGHSWKKRTLMDFIALFFNFLTSF